MRANNHGEGGIMALVALAASAVADRPRLRRGLLTAGVLGAALFCGDGVSLLLPSRSSVRLRD